MKKASKKKPVARNKANNDARRVAGKPPDGRTKAGRAWKAAQVERARRARNREADKLAAKAAVTGSWVDLKDHPANKALRETYAEMDRGGEIRLSGDDDPLMVKCGTFKPEVQRAFLHTDAVGGPGGKATVAYWRVGV